MTFEIEKPNPAPGGKWVYVQTQANYMSYNKELMCLGTDANITLDARLTFDTNAHAAHMTLLTTDDNANQSEFGSDIQMSWEQAEMLLAQDDVMLPQHPVLVTICNGLALFENGKTVNLLQIQAACNFAFQEIGDPEFSRACDEMAKLTGKVQGPSGVWINNV